MGLFGGIAGIFGATQEKRAAEEAGRIINQARQEAVQKAGELSAESTPFLNKSLDFFDAAAGYQTEDRALLRKLIADTEAADLGQGFSTADEIALKDATRLMNENLVGTGNLRSGAAGFYGMELARRVTADVRQRQVDRRLGQLQLLFGAQNQGASQTASIANFSGQAGSIGMQGKSLATQLYASSLGLVGAQASAELAKGRALSSQISSAGDAFDSVGSAGAAAYGAKSGEGSMAFLQTLFPVAKAA